MSGDHHSHPSSHDRGNPAASFPRAPHDLLAALFTNQRRWLERLATGETAPADDHPRLWHQQSVTAALTGQGGVICLAETRTTPDNEHATMLAALAWLRAQGCGDVLIWSATGHPALDLFFLAHGCDASFRPHWMARPLSGHLPIASPEPTVDIHLARRSDLAALRDSTDIPYVNADQFAHIQHLAGMPVRTRRVWLLVARERRATARPRVLGQAIVNISEGPGGRFAGLYNLAVHAQTRKQGIGTALTIAACNLAYDLRAEHIGLNATPDGVRIYEATGFRHVGDGQTWFLPGRRLAAPPDTEALEFAMAIGRGSLRSWGASGVIPRVLPNGETPLAFAARFCNAAAAQWLLEHGAQPDIVPLWVLGLHSEALALMHDPAALNRRIPPFGTTPLHEAVQRDDADLARHLIAAGADLSLTDDRYRSTPLGWAEALGRDAIAAMIRAEM